MERVTSRSGALDGLRGVFLAAPILVHLGLFGAGNGLWLAIGLFFTLSGFLITTLALGEVDRSGRLSLRGFWSRRLRRLMAAALLVLGLTVVVAWWLGWPAMDALRGDVFAALTWRANWHQLTGGGYWTGFTPSLTSHFWSLSLEEQIYVVLPLFVVVAVALRRRVRPATTVAVLSAIAWAVSWTILWRVSDPSRLYLSTFTRMGEAAAGCFTAAIAHRYPVRVPRPRFATRVVVALAIAELPVWILARGDTTGGVRWGITLSTPAVATAVALMWRHPTSAASRGFSLAPIAWLGRRSYGIYLLHIPIFDLFAFRLGVTRLPAWAMVVAVAATVACSAAMFRFVEEPVRTGHVARTREQFTGLLATGALAVSVLAWAGGGRGPRPILPPDNVTPPITTVVTVPTTSSVPTTSAVPPPTGASTSSTDVSGTTLPASPTTATSPAVHFPLAPGNVLVVGDSTAWVSFGAVRDSLGPLGWTADEVHMVGCPPGGDARIKTSKNGGAVYVRELGEEPGCDQWWNDSLPSWLDAKQPSLVVVIDTYGLAYAVDPDGNDQWCRLGDGSGRCETWAAARLRALTERIVEHVPSAEIVWTTPGHIDPFGPLDMPAAAIDTLTALMRHEAARSHMSLVEFGTWFDAHVDLTVDGTHLGPDGVAALTPWMAVELPAAAAGERLAPAVSTG